MKEIFPVDTFKELILTEFEGRMLPVPKKYDQFLTQMYGDYMTPPSKEMQEWYSHSIKAYRKSWLRGIIQTTKIEVIQKHNFSRKWNTYSHNKTHHIKVFEKPWYDAFYNFKDFFL